MEEMKTADAIICSMAEHNKTYTAAFKNLLDWCTRIDMNVFANKKMYLMSTSPGGYGGGNVMAAAQSFFPKCGANIVASFSLGKFHDNFKENKIIDELSLREFEAQLKLFEEAK